VQSQSGVRLLDTLLPFGWVSDLPLVIAGAMGTGRTVLSLELAAASACRSEPTILLSAEPGEVALQEAAALGLELQAPMRTGTLALLEMDAHAADVTERDGLVPLAEALLRELPNARTIIIDPVCSLLPELLDERSARALLRDFLKHLQSPGRRIVFTYATDAHPSGRGFERALSDLAGAYLQLERRAGTYLLRASKVRGPSGPVDAVAFAIGSSGSYPLHPERCDDTLSSSGRRQGSDGTSGKPRLVIALESDVERAQLQEWLADRYALELVADGLAALSFACARNPALLLLEPQLRGASGYEVIRALRGAGVPIPVLVALHHKARAADRVRPLVLGATDVIAKPFNAFELEHRIRTLLELPCSLQQGDSLEEAELVFMARTQSRVVNKQGFLEHAGRAVRLGSRFGFESTLLGLETASDRVFEQLTATIDHLLRVEDAFCALSENRGVVFLVCSRPRDAEAVARRIYADVCHRCQDEAQLLGWCASEAATLGEMSSAVGSPDWQLLFNDLQWLPDDSGASARSGMRIVTRHA